MAVIRLNKQWTSSISKLKYENLAVVVGVPQTAQNLVILRSCFTEDGQEMYKDLYCISYSTF